MDKKNFVNDIDLSGVAETLLIPLCVRALESQRPDAILKDEKAASLVQQIGCDHAKILEDIAEESRAARLYLTRQIDLCAGDFFTRHPQAVVLHIGCGLDCRFERVDNGSVEWFDLDFPSVIDLRRKLLGSGDGRYHLLAGSVLENGWVEAVSAYPGRPVLLLAESVLMYLTEAQVKTLFGTILGQLPEVELVFDAFSPFLVWANNLRVKRTGVGTPAFWGVKRATDLESWQDGIRLLDTWHPYFFPGPRLAKWRGIRFIPGMKNIWRIFRFRLSQAVVP